MGDRERGAELRVGELYKLDVCVSGSNYRASDITLHARERTQLELSWTDFLMEGLRPQKWMDGSSCGSSWEGHWSGAQGDGSGRLPGTGDL